MYEDIIKTSRIFSELKSDAENKSLSRAYLFVGPDSLFADELCDCFLDEVITINDGKECAKKLKSGMLPDVVYFPREKNVSVNDINYITGNALVTPIELKTKFYIINKAQTMLLQAQNKLLKILEEPPEVVAFIIKADSKTSLLPTVVSRCRVIETMPFSVSELSSCNRILTSDCGDKELATTLCGGNLTLLEKMLTDKMYFSAFDKTVDMLTNMTHSSQAVRYLAFLNDYKDYFDWILSCLQIIFGDIMKKRYGTTPRLPRGYDDRISKLVEGFRPEAIAELMSEIDRLRERRKYNGNYSSIEDELLLKILEVKSKWLRL